MQIHPPDEAWQRRGEQERRLLNATLAAWLVVPVEHVGSTAVPSLPAKPILDLQAAPEECARFESEIRDALAGAADDLDLASWHALATMAANPLTSDKRAQVERAKTGGLTGLRARDEHGNWITL